MACDYHCQVMISTGKFSARKGTTRALRDPETHARVEPGTWGPYKKCKRCDIYLVWDGRFCPCCMNTLSVKPNQSLSRRNRHLARMRKLSRANVEFICAHCGKKENKARDDRVKFCSDACRKEVRKAHNERYRAKVRARNGV